MATTQIFPGFCDVDTWRNVMKNNSILKHEGKVVHFVLHTNGTWLPTILVEAGFFPSGNRVKKNQPALWRDAVHGEQIRLSWAHIKVFIHGPNRNG